MKIINKTPWKTLDQRLAKTYLRKWQAAIFRVFKPQRIEYVCKGDETEGQLQKLVERGISPVRVERVGQVEMFPQPAKGD